MATCMLCGHGAGVAAAVAVKAGVACTAPPIRDVQRELLRQNAHLGNADRLAELGL